MKPVATINNVPVYSDKRVAGIVNTRVNFVDGSYADVSTMEVVNKGGGFITLKTPPGESAGGKAVTMTKTFKASRLSIADVDANVDIQPGGDQIVVTLTGPKSAADDIAIRQEGDQVVVKGSGNSGGSVVMSGMSVVGMNNVSIVSVGGGSIRANNVSINMTGGEQQTKVSITVPIGTAVDVSGATGAVTIGDTQGSLVLNQRGMSKARVGIVGIAQLLASGQSKIRVCGVQKTLMANVSGQSGIKVDGGKVDTLMVTTSGQSEFRFDGEATDATLTASGQSEVDVAHVTNRPIRSKSGQANITVRNRD